MKRARRDDEFTAFVSARLPALRQVAYLLCQDWHRADDLVQVAITRLYAHWGRAAVMDHTEAYVRTILVREFLHERRSAWTRRVSLGADPPDRVVAWPDHDAAVDLKAALAALRPALTRTPLASRWALSSRGRARRGGPFPHRWSLSTCGLSHARPLPVVSP